MAGERVNKLQVNRGVEALLSTKRGESGDSTFPLHSVSYVPSPESTIHQDLRFRALAIEFGSYFSKSPIQGTHAEGTVVIRGGDKGLYTAELDLEDTVDHFLSLPFIALQTRAVHFADIPVPEIALAPNEQLVIGHRNIIDGSRDGSVYTLYTQDAENSEWSIHIAKRGLQAAQIPRATLAERFREWFPR